MRISTNQIFQRALNNLLTQQARASKLQEQVQTGLRVQIPSDDPVAAAQIELLNQRINSTALLQENRQAVEASLNLEESIIGDMVNTMHRLREIQVQAGSAILSEQDRKSMATEVKSLLSQLQDYANSKDSNGNYIFSGGQTNSPAVSVNSSGNYIYNGDSTQRFQGVTGTLQMAINDTGDNLFMRIPNGNGRFTVTATATPNLGTSVIDSGAVTNNAAYVPDDYTLSYATNTQGQLVVMVSGASSGNVLPPSGLVDDAPLYQDGAAINFNGIEITSSGAPQAGDSFAIKPAKNESVFSTAQRMITNLNKPFNSATDKAAVNTENNQILAQLDSAEVNLLSYQADIGARLNQLDSADRTNTNLIDSSKEVLKQLQEADPAEVISAFNLQLINLQASQQSFVKIQGLSLFNYI